MESESASITPALGPQSFRRIIEVPFETCTAALYRWHLAAQGDEFRVGEVELRGPIEHDGDSGTCRIHVHLARGPLRPMRRMRLNIDRWSSMSTAVELIPCGRIRPTAAYFRAGHRLLNSLTRALRQSVPPAHTPDTAPRAHAAMGSGRP